MTSIIVDEVKLNVAQMDRTGNRRARDLILVHGLASNMGFWSPRLLDALSECFRVTLLDMRGHGRSQTTEWGYRPARLARDLGGAARALELTRPHIIAHSYGGVAALRWAADAPEDVGDLMVLDSHFGLGRAEAATSRQDFDTALAAALAEAGIAVDFTDPFSGIRLITEVARRRLDGAVEMGKDPRVRYLVELMPLRVAERWVHLVDTTAALSEILGPDGLDLAALRRIRTRITAVYGERSQAIASGRILAGAAPRCDLRVIPDAGHFFAATRVDALLSICDDAFAAEPAAGQAAA